LLYFTTFTYNFDILYFDKINIDNRIIGKTRNATYYSTYFNFCKKYPLTASSSQTLVSTP